MKKITKAKITYVIKEIVKRWTIHNFSAFGAQIAYFLLMSLFPFIMFMLSLLGFLSIPVKDTLELIKTVTPRDTFLLLENYVEYILTTRNGDILSISFLIAVWSSSRGINAIIRALNVAYGVKETRAFISRKILSFVLTLLFAVAIVLALVVPSLSKAILSWITSILGITHFLVNIWSFIRWIIIIVILGLVIGIIYLFGPNAKVKKIEIIPGTIFTTISWIVLSIGFSIYVNNFGRYTLMYGSLGTIIILMIWLFFTGIIIMMGGEINSILRTSNYEQTKKRQRANANFNRS